MHFLDHKSLPRGQKPDVGKDTNSKKLSVLFLLIWFTLQRITKAALGLTCAKFPTYFRLFNTA